MKGGVKKSEILEILSELALNEREKPFPGENVLPNFSIKKSKIYIK